MPTFETTIEATAPLLTIALAMAPCPPPPTKVILGVITYPSPPFRMVTLDTFPVATMDVAIAVCCAGTITGLSNNPSKQIHFKAFLILMRDPGLLYVHCPHSCPYEDNE